jgi:hypothetical protein
VRADSRDALKINAPTVPAPNTASGSAAAVNPAAAAAIAFRQPDRPECKENDLYLFMFFYLRRAAMTRFFLFFIHIIMPDAPGI